MTASAETIASLLLRWYDSHARSLPWRIPPGSPDTPDPYRIWLSEIMLQQTTVAAVKPYFAEFTRVWPTVDALAAAADDAVMAAWAGLGYYSRARNLAKAARVVAVRGGFPDDEAGLRELPGVGDYTAAAIAGIAFGRRAIALDANVIRVVARLFAEDTPLPRGKTAIKRYAETIWPKARGGDFTQALMDLGATICTARAPKCLLCPLADRCAGRRGDAERYPVKPPKKLRPQRAGTAFWIETQQRQNSTTSRHVWLVRRAAKGMLGGMRALPDDGWSARADGSGNPPLTADWRDRGTVRHGFTHADLTLSVRSATVPPDRVPPGDGEWWPVAELDSAGLPTLFAKAAARATG